MADYEQNFDCVHFYSGRVVVCFDLELEQKSTWAEPGMLQVGFVEHDDILSCVNLVHDVVPLEGEEVGEANNCGRQIHTVAEEELHVGVVGAVGAWTEHGMEHGTEQW